ncbi:hypothetical protein SDC9_105320 [bioreactor metagenome]|uniref:Uncharacterized protein n=1 Tax=bioreactor metagenome TaxID=1076179 RepID=A0A645AZA7_9ZZZZ
MKIPLIQTDVTKIKYMIFLSYDFSENQEILLAINQLLEECYLDETNLDKLCETEQPERIIKAIIRRALQRRG